MYVVLKLKLTFPELPRTSLFCRIRKYRGLKSAVGATSFGVRDREVSYVPYKLTLSFREINEFENREMYMVVSASAVTSPFGGEYEMQTPLS